MQTIQKNAVTVILLLLSAQLSVGQEITRDLYAFHKVVVSPKINLILEKGDHESIRLTYSNVSPDKINIKVHGKTLHVYLDDAKVTEKLERINPREKRNIYRDAEITAYVTYTNLERLEIRGNQELTCNGPLEARKFTLKAYGENEIRLASVKAQYLKTSLYGENDLKIKGGNTEYQKYRLFGENRIDTQDLKSYETTTNVYGESKIKVSTTENLRINAFGESQISYNGDASINRGLIFGRTQIHKMN